MKRGSVVRVKSTQHVGVIEGFASYSSKMQNAYVRFPASDKPDELYQLSTLSFDVIGDKWDDTIPAVGEEKTFTTGG